MKRIRLNLRPNKIDFYLILHDIAKQQKYGAYVLDFAAAGLKHAEYFSKQEYFAADISLADLRKVPVIDESKIYKIAADLKAVPFKEKSFDLVLSTHTLEALNLDDVQLKVIIENISRLVKNKGMLAFNYTKLNNVTLKEITNTLNKEYKSLRVIRYGGVFSCLYEDLLFRYINNTAFPRQHRLAYLALLPVSLFIYLLDMPFKKMTGNKYFIIASLKS